MAAMKTEIYMVDPPWPKKKGGKRTVRPNQGRSMCYETLDVLTIFDLLDREVFSSAAENHCVFMWVVDEFLHLCETKMAERGYKRHCRFVWDKENGVAPAFTVRYAHEYLIWFYKSKLLPIATTERGRIATVFRERSREHSRKPEIGYQVLERMYPMCTKMDVFARQRRKGWEAYGNQLDYFPPT